MGYSIDLREKVMGFLSRGYTMREARDAFGVSLTTVNNWKRKLRESGDLKDKPPRRGFKKIDPSKLRAYVGQHPDAYLAEIAEAFGCCASAIRKAFGRLRITRKKKQKNSGSRSPGK